MKKKVIVLVIWMLFLMSGCTSETADHSADNSAMDNEESDLSDSGSGAAADIMDESEQLAEEYGEVYRAALKDGALAQLDTIREIMESLGVSGYAVVDNENQINMIHPEVIREFDDSVKSGQSAETTLLIVTDDGGFVRYDLTVSDGVVQVGTSRISWENGVPQAEKLDSYEAYTWKMDEENGYLYIEKEQPAGYDGPIEYTAVRVEPLDEELRELNRKYILPAGYRRTNLFLTDWDETDYGELDFYDLFEEFYFSEYGKEIPYKSDFDKLTYEVPAEEFEAVIGQVIEIEPETLRAYTVYDSGSSSYVYTTRCREDWGHPCFVKPEVIGYEKLDDGTIRLKVSSVSQEDDPEHTFSHEVVIRLLADGGYQYVSNHILTVDHETDFDWFSRRLTVQQWEEKYGFSDE